MENERAAFQSPWARISAGSWLVGVVGLGLVLRAFVTFRGDAVWVNTDSVGYAAMADAILRREPMSHFPNGYPLILAGLTWLVGEDWRNAAAVSLNVVLSTLIVVLAGRIAEGAGTARAGVLAAGLVAVWPNQINYTRQLLSETPATFLLVGGILLLLRQHAFWAGAALYAAAFVRSSLLLTVPLVAIWLIVTRQGRKQILLFGLGVGACLAADLTLQKAGVVGTPNNVGPNLLLASRTGQAGAVDFSPGQFSEAERAAPLATYLNSARERPVAFMRQRLGSLWRLWGPWPAPGDPARPRTWLTRVAIGLRFPAVILALVTVLVRPRWLYGWLLATPIVALTVVHGVFFSTPRFSFPAEPFILILVAVGAAARFDQVAARRPGQPPASRVSSS